MESDRRVVARVGTAGGVTREVGTGHPVLFDRGPDVDLRVAAGRGLSRRAGMVAALEGGVLVTNLSRTHALHLVGADYRIRLPRLEGGDEPSGGWYARSGAFGVGSQAMFDEGDTLVVRLLRDGAGAGGTGEPGPPGDRTLLPLRLDPDTKLFMAALMWVRPWLTDPARTTPLPRTPEIARAALEFADAHHELERMDADPAYRDRLAARVGEHVKALRQKIAERGLARPGVRLSDEVVAGILLEHAVLTPADLARLDDTRWRAREQDLWWTRPR